MLWASLSLVSSYLFLARTLALFLHFLSLFLPLPLPLSLSLSLSLPLSLSPSLSLSLSGVHHLLYAATTFWIASCTLYFIPLSSNAPCTVSIPLLHSIFLHSSFPFPLSITFSLWFLIFLLFPYSLFLSTSHSLSFPPSLLSLLPSLSQSLLISLSLSPLYRRTGPHPPRVIAGRWCGRKVRRKIQCLD